MTLAELLVSIGVAVVLFSIIFPTLGRARAVADRAATTDKLRQHALVTAAYSADHRDAFPRPFEPNSRMRLLSVEGVTVRAAYFEAYWLWNIPLARSYYGVRPNNPVFQSNEYLREVGDTHSNRASLWYSATLITDPSYWNPATRQSGFDQLRQVRQPEVLYASKKALFYASQRDSSIIRVPGALLSFADGSAAWTGQSMLMPQYPHGSAPPSSPPGPPGRLTYGVPGMHTLDGVRGRDIE